MGTIIYLIGLVLAILAVIDGFIKKVMRVDNKVESAEKKAYVAWKIGVGLM